MEGLKKFEKLNFERLNALAALTRSKLQKLHRNNITALITVDVHARDIITDMVCSMFVVKTNEIIISITENKTVRNQP